MRVDMHMHTTASDGTWIPIELVKNIMQAGIGLFAVTDHDSVENVSKVRDCVKGSGLHFISGIEINTSLFNKNIHILGYGIDTENKALSSVLSVNKAFLACKADENIRLLAEKGYSVSPDEYLEYDYLHGRGGWKTLNYCIDKGLCKTSGDFFTLLDSAGSTFDPSGFAAPADAVSAIREAGGIAVLAHPGARIYDCDYKALIDRVVREGIDGIECFHTEHDESVSGYCLEYCKRNNLYVTGGSDCHGDFVKERALGKPEIYLEQLRLGKLV